MNARALPRETVNCAVELDPSVKRFASRSVGFRHPGGEQRDNSERLMDLEVGSRKLFVDAYSLDTGETAYSTVTGLPTSPVLSITSVVPGDKPNGRARGVECGGDRS
jgi:hypothetical protein